MSSTNTEAVKGVWKRLWEEDALGDTENADRDTLVLWTQTPKSGIYVDLRLPLHSPGRYDSSSSRCGQGRTATVRPTELQGRGMDLSDLTSEEIPILLRQKSFAGVLEYSLGDTTASGEALAKDKPLAELANQKDAALPLCTCFWRRDIDYQPPSGGLDIGVCAAAPLNPDGSVDLRETGDDASYAEGWHRLPGTDVEPFLACKLISENDTERKGYWVRAGNSFAYAIGRPNDAETAKKLLCNESSVKLKECVGMSLADAVSSLNTDVSVQFQLIGTYVAVFGEVTTDTGEWSILHSTHPALVGCQLVGVGPNSCSTLKRDTGTGPIQAGDIVCQTLVGGMVRQWEVIEISGITALVET